MKGDRYIYSALARLVSVAYFFILIKALTSYLSPEDYGHFNLVFNAAAYLSVILFGQQSIGLLRFYHVETDKLKLYKTILIQVVAASILLLIALVVSRILFKDTFGMWPIYILILAVSTSLYNLSVTVVRAKLEFNRVFKMALSQAALAIGIILFIYKDISWEYVIVVISASYIAVFIMSAVSRAGSMPEVFTADYDAPLGRRLLAYGWPLVAIALFNSMLSTSDQFMLKYYGYESAVGVYAANYYIGEKSILFPFSVLIMVFVPMLYRDNNAPDMTALRKINRVTIVFSAIALLIIICEYAFSRDISLLISNKLYIDGSHIIPLVAIGSTILGVVSLYAEMLLLAKRSGLIAIAYMISLTLNIVLNYVFIKSGGMMAAVYTTLVSYGLLLIIILTFVKVHFVYNVHSVAGERS